MIARMRLGAGRAFFPFLAAGKPVRVLSIYDSSQWDDTTLVDQHGVVTPGLRMAGGKPVRVFSIDESSRSDDTTHIGQHGAPTRSGRHNVAQHVSAGKLQGPQESPVGATQITFAQSVGFVLSPLTGLGTAEGPFPQGLRPGLHSFAPPALPVVRSAGQSASTCAYVLALLLTGWFRCLVRLLLP